MDCYPGKTIRIDGPIMPISIDKRKRRDYKTDYLNAKGKIVLLVWALVLFAAFLAWTLKGNVALQEYNQQLLNALDDKADSVTISKRIK